MDSQKSSKATTPAPRKPQRKRGKERVSALLAAGAEVFAESGYDAATMTGIAARAGASIGSLYQFFPTKYLLAETLHAEQIGVLLERLGELRTKAEGKSAADLADDVFQTLTAFLESHPAFVPLADRRDIDKDRKAKTRAQLRQRITDLMSHAVPPLPPGKAEVVATVILQLMRSVIALLNDREQPLRDAVLAELRVMLRNHLEKVSG
jgi:AcrR family transcriptional regulator